MLHVRPLGTAISLIISRAHFMKPFDSSELGREGEKRKRWRGKQRDKEREGVGAEAVSVSDLFGSELQIKIKR